MRFALSLGDVFTIPVDDERCMLGQVVSAAGKGLYFFAVFDRVLAIEDAELLIDDVLSEEIAFLAQSVDGKLYHGHWTLVGNRPVREGLPFPAFRSMSAGVLHVKDHLGERRRKAEESEVEALTNELTIAPARFELAAKARAGLIPWEESFDKVVPKPEARESLFFPAGGG